MLGQNRFLIFIVVGIVLLFSFWYRPPPSVRAYAPAWAVSKPANEEVAVEKPAGGFAGLRASSFIHFEATSEQEVHRTSIAAPIHLEPAVAAPTVDPIPEKLHESTAVIALATEVVHTFSAPAYTHTTTRPVDGYHDFTDVDEYAYLHASKSEDELATGTAIAAPKETGYVDDYAYLRHSEVIAVGTAGLAHAHTAALSAPSGFTTSVVAAHHSGLTLAPSETFSHALSTASVANDATGETSFPDPDAEEWGSGTWFFQGRLTDYPLPEIDVAKLKAYKAHNYEGPGHETFATFLATRNASLEDPYFLATLQVAHRLLWDPDTKSKSHPFTVFVAPFIPEPQRDWIRATGALVRELDLIEWHPTHPTKAASRWRDQFTKLNLWAQTEFSRILYLDTDAFPIKPIDELWEIAQTQTCKPNQLKPEDELVIAEICDYTFAATYDGGINAGMMIFNPNMAMHARLLRESQDSDSFDQDFVEQAFLNEAYAEDGPFPVQGVDRKWNAIFSTNDDEGVVNVVHEKLWAMWMTDHFAKDYFRQNWDQMLTRYKTPEWLQQRLADGLMEV